MDMFGKRLMTLLFLIGISVVNAQVPWELGADPSAYKHKDEFSTWQKISDGSIAKGKIGSVYYRTISCQTIGNKRTGKIAHPFATIEVKAPEELKGNDAGVSGFLIIAGEMHEFINERLTTKKDTIKQFFRVTAVEPIFSLNSIVIDYYRIDGIYLSIFDNDISEVYSKEDDKGYKKLSSDTDKNNSPKSDEKDKTKLSETQVKKVFDLFFGAGSSEGIKISDEDKRQAEMLLSELMKGSCNMAMVEGLNGLEPSLTSFVQATYTALLNCRAAKKGAYYEIVRKAIANNFRSSFLQRKENGLW